MACYNNGYDTTLGDSLNTVLESNPAKLSSSEVREGAVLKATRNDMVVIQRTGIVCQIFQAWNLGPQAHMTHCL